MPTDFGSSSSAYRSSDLDGADPGADQKRRARWRLLGAAVFSLAVATAAYQLMLQEPRPLAQDFVILMPLDESPPVARGQPQPVEPPSSPEASSLTAERVEAPVVVTVTPSSSSGSNGSEAKSSARPTSSGPGAGGSRAWFVQLGAYDSREAAAAMAVKVRGLGYSATVQDAPASQGTLYRVRVGPFNESQAKAYLERVRAQGYASFLVRP